MEADADAEPETVDPPDHSPLSKAAYAGNVALVRQLIAAGHDVNGVVAIGGSPLHAAINGNSRAVIQILLDAGADVGLKGPPGWTPLFRAVSNACDGASQRSAGDFQDLDCWLIRELLSRGADPRERSAVTYASGLVQMQTPTEVAIGYGQTELATLLHVVEATAEGLAPKQVAAVVGGVDETEVRACLDFVGEVGPFGPQVPTPEG